MNKDWSDSAVCSTEMKEISGVIAASEERPFLLVFVKSFLEC